MAKKLKKSTTLAQLVSSHKRLLKAFRHQTEEIGQLRRYILAMKASYEQEKQIVPKSAWEWSPEFKDEISERMESAHRSIVHHPDCAIRRGPGFWCNCQKWSGPVPHDKPITDGHGNDISHLVEP